MRELWRAFILSGSLWGRRFVALLGMIVDSVTFVILPLILKRAFDMLSGGAGSQDLDVLNQAMVYLILFAVLRALAIYGEIYFQENTGNLISHDLRQLLFRKLLRLPFSYFDRTKTGDLMSILTKDVDAVRDGTGFVVLLIVVNLITIVGIVIAMLRLNPTFAAIVLASFPVLLLVAVVYSRMIGPLYKDVQERSGGLHTVAQENVSGIRVVKAFVRHREEEAKFGLQNSLLYRTNLRIAYLNSLVHPGLDFVGGAASLIALGVGGVYVIQGHMTLGTLVAFTNFADFLVWPIRQMGWLAELTQRAMAGAKRVFAVLDERNSLPESAEDAVDREIVGEVEFRNVSFTYEDGEEALADFSLHIRPGEKVCLLGMTGSGKTTVANLVPRFYDVTSGTLLIDGTDVRKWRLSALRRQIGFVFQDNFLFSTTVHENLTMGAAEVTEQRVKDVAQVAQAESFISELPKQYDTLVGERGVGLSGGERQRVAIARALLRDPKILIFDDSTASLDVRTEAALKKALEQLFSGRTVLIIAQRVTSAMTADRIVVLEGGRIVEQGTHRELLAADGIYANLYRIQTMDDRNGKPKPLPIGVTLSG